MSQAFVYAPILRYSPNDSEQYYGKQYALSKAVEVTVFDNEGRLDLYLAEYSDFVEQGYAVKSLFEKTRDYSDGYAMIAKNTFVHSTEHLAGGGICILKNENGASCFYNVYSQDTKTYRYSNSYLLNSDFAEAKPELRLLDEDDGKLDKEDNPGFGGVWSCNTIFTSSAQSTCKRQLPTETDSIDEQINVDFRFTGGDSVTIMQYRYDTSTFENVEGFTVVAPGTWLTETVILAGATTLASAGLVAAAALLSF